MARFYMHLHECASVTRDEEGQEFGNLSEACSAATAEARAIMADEVLEGRLCLKCHIELVNGETGVRVALMFRDALTITSN